MGFYQAPGRTSRTAGLGIHITGFSFEVRSGAVKSPLFVTIKKVWMTESDAKTDVRLGIKVCD